MHAEIFSYTIARHEASATGAISQRMGTRAMANGGYVISA